MAMFAQSFAARDAASNLLAEYFGHSVVKKASKRRIQSGLSDVGGNLLQLN